MRWIVWIFIVLVGFFVRAEILSMGVGRVQGALVTSRDVQIHRFLEAAMMEKNLTETDLRVGLDSKAFAKAVQQTLLENVVHLEAQSFSLVAVPESEVAQLVKKMRPKLQKLAAWRELEVSPQEYELALKKKLQARRFVEFRSRSSVIPVTDADAQRYFNDNRVKFGSLPFENFRESIKTLLTKAQVERRMKEWYDVLLSKYQVKNLVAEM